MNLGLKSGFYSFALYFYKKKQTNTGNPNTKIVVTMDIDEFIMPSRSSKVKLLSAMNVLIDNFKYDSKKARRILLQNILALMKLQTGYNFGHFLTKSLKSNTKIMITPSPANPIAMSPRFLRMLADLQPRPLND